MADKTYWLGELIGHKRVGGIKVGGKLYAIGEPFPADKIDQKKLAGFKKAGCVGSAPFQVADSVDDDLSMLKGRLSEMQEAATVDGKNIAGLQDAAKVAVGRISELELDLEAAGGDAKKVVDLEDAAKVDKGIISDLEAEVKRLTGEAQDAADKKAAHVQDHVDNPVVSDADLKTDNEEKAALIDKQKGEIKALKKAAKKENA